ncbi:MAG: PAS domain S-box protein [Desulfobacterales bacterium]|nr:PAS domain S-box protein [Desulfobacterales bacterium]
MKRIIFFTTFACCFWQLHITNAHSVKPVILNDEQEKYPSGLHLEYLEDSAGRLTINDVASTGHKMRFIHSETGIPIIGFSDSVFWVRVHVRNECRDQANWRLMMQLAYLDAVDLYLPLANGEFKIKQAGDKRPFNVREIEFRQSVFKIALPPQSEIILYLRIQSTGFMIFDPILWTADAFYTYASHDQLFSGFFLGGLCIMGVYNLVLFIVLGERSYLYYVLMLFGVAFHFATLEYGLSYQYLWPNQIVFNHIATIFFPSISMFFALNFAISFLQTKIYAPVLHPYLLGLRVPYLFFMIFSVMQKINWTQAGLAFITVPAITIIMMAGVQAWRKGYQPARYYILAWSILWLDIILVALHVLKFMDKPGHFHMTRFFGISLLLFLSLALADRINVLKQKTEKAKAETDHVNRQLTDHQKRLAKGEKKYRTLFEESNDTIFITDMDGQIEDVSPSCETLLDCTRTEALSRNALEAYSDPADRARFMELILENESLRDFEVKLRRKDGQEIDTLVSATLRYAENGEVMGFQGIIRDITVQKQAEAEKIRALKLQNEKELAEAASRTKSVFLANISHVLRTPLHGILGFARMLEKDDSLTKTQKQSIDIIYRNGEQLLMLVNDILDFTKIEANKLKLHPSQFALSGLLAHLAEVTRFNAAQKGLGFTYDAPAHMPGPVCGDQERLRQILLNLLKNAVKFTKHGEIMFRVKISINKLSDLPGTSYKKMKNGKPLTANIRFEIEDTGPGIPREQLEGIFQPFQQADQYSLQEGSTGLGLSVSQHLAILMGSRIHVSSVAGQGATFWLDLELPIAEFSLAKVSSESLISENTVPETGDHLKPTVAELPAEWLEQIKHAAKRADFMMLSNITANIRQHEPAIADMLEPLIEDFQYDEILALVQKTGEGDENPNR